MYVAHMWVEGVGGVEMRFKCCQSWVITETTLILHVLTITSEKVTRTIKIAIHVMSTTGYRLHNLSSSKQGCHQTSLLVQSKHIQ